MSRGALAGLVFLCLAACGETPAPIQETDLGVRVRFVKDTVAPGEGLAIEIVRVWSKTLDPSPWDDAMLAPLVVRPVSTSRREDALRVEETRRVHAYAFTREDVAIPAIPFAGKPKDGGDLRIAATRPLTLRVRPAVDAAAPGAPELPGTLPGRRFPWLLLALLLAGAAIALSGRRLRMPRAAPPSVDGPGRLDEAAGLAQVAEVVRAHVAAHHGIPAPRRTSEEVLGALPARDASLLGPVLTACDLSKFADEQHADVSKVVEAARAFMRRGGRAP